VPRARPWLVRSASGDGRGLRRRDGPAGGFGRRVLGSERPIGRVPLSDVTPAVVPRVGLGGGLGSLAVVLVDETAKAVVSADRFAGREWHDHAGGCWWMKVAAAVGSLVVVVLDVGVDD
jgi:hypothetical protein